VILLSGSTGDRLKSLDTCEPQRDQASPSRSHENLVLRVAVAERVVLWWCENHPACDVSEYRMENGVAALENVEKSVVSAGTPRGVLHATDYGVECTHRGRREREERVVPHKVDHGASVRGP
jgi:hypothetical protein